MRSVPMGGTPDGQRYHRNRTGRGERSARPWYRVNRNVSGPARRHQLHAGVGHAGRSGVGDEGNRRPAPKLTQQLRRALMGIVFMKAHHRSGDAVMTQQPGRSSGVFRSDEMGFPQYPKCPQCDVLQVADRRGDHVERAATSRRIGREVLLYIGRMRATKHRTDACTHRSHFPISF